MITTGNAAAMSVIKVAHVQHMHTCNNTSHSKLSYPEGTVDHVVLLRLCCICDGCVCYVCGVCMSNEKQQVQIFNITTVEWNAYRYTELYSAEINRRIVV